SVSQPMAVSGTLTLPDDASFDLSRCVGFDLTIDVFITNPDAFVQSFRGVLVLCDISTEDYVFNLGASSDQRGQGAEVFFADANGPLGGHDSNFTLTNERFTATIGLEAIETSTPAGDAIIDASFTRAARTSVTTDDSGPRSKVT